MQGRAGVLACGVRPRNRPFYNDYFYRGGDKGAEFMLRYAGHWGLALGAALGALVSCGSGITGDGIFKYTAPESSADIVSLIPIPIRREYFVNHEFNRARDLSVVAVLFNGETRPVPADEIDIRILEGEEEIRLDSEVYIFKKTGEKIISLVWAKQKTGYAVWVRSPAEAGEPSVPGTGDTEIIINVIG
jgi:hypothetical protein